MLNITRVPHAPINALPAGHNEALPANAARPEGFDIEAGEAAPQHADPAQLARLAARGRRRFIGQPEPVQEAPLRPANAFAMYLGYGSGFATTNISLLSAVTLLPLPTYTAEYTAVSFGLAAIGLGMVVVSAVANRERQEAAERRYIINDARSYGLGFGFGIFQCSATLGAVMASVQEPLPALDVVRYVHSGLSTAIVAGIGAHHLYQRFKPVDGTVVAA